MSKLLSHHIDKVTVYALHFQAFGEKEVSQIGDVLCNAKKQTEKGKEPNGNITQPATRRTDLAIYL